MTVSSGAIPAVQLRRPAGDQALPTRAGWAIMCQPEWLRIQCSHPYELEPRWGEVDLRVAPSRGSEARLLDSGSGGTMMGPDDDDQGVLLGLTKAKLAGPSRPQQISSKGLQPVR